jgi:GNAT superfamily N-acetyltransferase
MINILIVVFLATAGSKNHMAAALTVQQVETKADFETFFRFPWALYKDNPYWVPPLVSMQRHKLDKAKNPTWKHMQGEYYIARRGDQPVGTIAAFINDQHNNHWNERLGFFGAFELVDDQEVADALLNAAADYVKARGCTGLRGPATFTTNEECGLLIEGFDDLPVVAYSYNPAYYQKLVENAGGFEKVMDLYGYYLTLQGTVTSGAADKVMRVIAKNNERRGITVRPPQPGQLRQDITTLKNIFNSAWDKNWGFVPFTDEELDQLVNDLGSYLDRDLTLLAEVEGKPVAFLLTVPDLNQLLRRVYPRPGKPDPLSMAQIFWHWKIRPKITRVRIPFMGVEEGYRGIGVEAAMFAALYQRAIELAPKRGWQYADGGWVLETNDAMSRLCESFEGRVYKRFRFYERKL